MVSSKILRILAFTILFTSFFSLSFGAFPEFDFEEEVFPAGPVTLNGEASSGTRVSLLVNGNFIGNRDIIKDEKVVLLNGTIQNQEVAIGQTLTLISNNPSRVYRIKIGDGPIQTLTFGDEITFRSFEEGDVVFRDDETNTVREISVEDEIVEFSFEGMEDFLENENNNLIFTLKSPLNTLEDTEIFDFNVFYEKFPNSIFIKNFSNVTNEREVFVSGLVEDPSSPLFFVVNQPGNIANSGILRSIPLSGTNFNITISELREGNNSIRFLTTEPSNPNQFNGEKKALTLVDTVPPEINIVSGLDLFTNEARLELNISTDAVEINVTFDNRTTVEEVEDGSVIVSLSLDKGSNFVELVAIDVAGNIKKESHLIEFDRDRPKLVEDSLSPEELFTGSKTSHFFFQEISGRTNKAGVKMEIFTIAGDSIDREGNRVSCDDFTQLFFRNLGQIDRQNAEGPEVDFNESQLSLLGLLNQRKTLTTGSDGSFKTFISLQEDDFDRGDQRDFDNAIEDQRNAKVGSVKSKNEICFVMVDKFGNGETDSFSVTLDAGNTMWRATDITTIPNNVYASEIENTGDSRSGSGKVEVGVIATFDYIGPGQVTKLDSFRISMDRKGSADSKFASVESSRLNFRLNKETGEMLVFFPVLIDKLNKEPLDYPPSLRFAFEARVTYQVDSVDIPIDEVNPIFFQAGINIEKPLDHTKWLTPELINSTLAFLNKTITITRKATEYTGFAAVAGVLTCTGAKFWHAYEIAGLDPDKPEDKKKIEEANRDLYKICDRVACTASPFRCEEKVDPFTDPPGGQDNFPLGSTITNDQLGDERYLRDEAGNILGEVEGSRFSGRCDYDGDEVADDGVMMSGTVTKFNTSTSSLGHTFRAEEELRLVGKCVKAEWGTGPDGKDILTGVDYSTVGGICYSAADPNYDDMRCNFFGADGEGDSGGVEGRDPANSIFSSVRCGCITDTHSHLQNWLKIQESIQKCLEQAKIGDVKGSYCERLLSQAVCDIATNIVLPEVERSIVGRSSPGGEGEGRTFDFLKQLRKTDSAMSDRYSGTVLSQAGLQSDQLINKACVAAVTGDWSVLTENILGAIDKNQIEPTFGPPFPESRLQGYNPITGDLSIQYRFTHAAISGGSRIRTTVDFVCDPQGPSGQYCPDDGLISSSDVPNSGIRKKILTVREGGSVQDTIVITDTKARFWYNKLRMVHEYEVKGNTRTQSREFNILHKSETLLASCAFSGGTLGSGAGFRCDTLFSNDALQSLFEIDQDKTKLVPRTPTGTTRTFFSGDPVFLDLHYSLRNNDGAQDSVALAYFAQCQGTGGDSNQFFIDSAGSPFTKTLDTSKLSSILAGEVVGLFNIPEIDSSTTNAVAIANVRTTSADLAQDKYNAIRFASTTSIDSIANNFDKVQLLDINGAIIDDKPVTVQITQNFNVNNPNSNLPEKFIDLKQLFGDKFDDKVREIRLVSPNKIQNLVIELVRVDNGIQISENNPSKPFNVNQDSKLSAGTCTLKARLLPTSEALALTIENFETFSSTGSIDGENIQLSDNIKDNSIFSTTFSIRSTNSIDENLGQSSAQILRPQSSQMYCAKINSETGKVTILPKIEGEYIYVKSINPLLTSRIPDAKIRYSLSSDFFGEIDNGVQDLKKIESFDVVPKTIEFNLNRFDSQIKKRLEDFHSNGAVTFLAELVESSQNRIPLKLSYTIFEPASEDRNEVILESKDVEFFLGGSTSCEGSSQTNSVTIPNQATPNLGP